MLVSREADYALRILRLLADGVLHKAQDISESEQIPKQFIYKILKKLERAEILRIRHGIKGGCILTASLAQVTLLDVIRAVEDSLAVNACTADGYQCQWTAQHGRCCYHKGLLRLQQRIEQELRAVTLQGLLLPDTTEPTDGTENGKTYHPGQQVPVVR